MEIVVPAYMAVSEFDEFYRDLFGGEGFDAYRLLQGLDNKTVEVGRDLWWLSRVALRCPEVVDVLERRPRPTCCLQGDGGGPGLPGRARDPPGRLRAPLRDLGDDPAELHRGPDAGPQDPQGLHRRAEADSPVAETERLADQREAAIAEARGRLQAYPAPVAAQFEAMLEAAQAGLVLTEDHNFWIDFYGVDAARQSGHGGRPAADHRRRHRQPADIFWLTVDEVRQTAPPCRPPTAARSSPRAAPSSRPTPR